MKKVALLVLVLMMAMMIMSCDDTRHYYGLANKETKMEGVEYQISPTNVIIGILLIEVAVIPTVYVAGWALYESVDPVFLEE